MTNTGTIDVTSGSSLSLQSSNFTLGGVIEADASSTITIAGTIDNAGLVFSLTGTGTVAVSATIDGGTVDVASGTNLILSGSVLNAVTIDGDLSVSGQLTIEDGLTLNGTLTIADGDNGLYFVGSQALGGSGTIVLGDEASPYYTYYNYIYTDAAASTLTIDSGITISGDYGVLGGYYISYYGYNAYGGPIVNEGTIQADVSGGSVTVMGNGWQNTGTLEATNGATLNLLGTCLGTGEVQVNTGGGVDRHPGRGDGNRHVNDQRHADGRRRSDAQRHADDRRR